MARPRAEVARCSDSLISGIVAIPTAVARIYGINFDMPELKWEYRYYMIVGAIFSVCGLFCFRFSHYGWL